MLLPVMFHVSRRSTALCRLDVRLLLLIALASFRVDAFPTGAPDSACSDIMPQHGASAQTSTSPYRISTSVSSYSSGQTITVTLSSSGSSVFEGVLIQARLTSNGANVGSFSSPPSGFKSACGGKAITHTSQSQKSTATFTWTGQGNVEFVATVVQTKTVFWTNVKSFVVTDASTPPTGSLPSSSSAGFTPSTTSLQAVERSSSTNVDTTSCNTAKSCFRQPSQCSTGSCSFLLTWTYNDTDQTVSFELEAAVSSVDSWIAFGLSKDTDMGSDSVVECVYNDLTSSVNVRMSWNTDNNDNHLLNDNQLGLVSGSLSGGYVNGHMVCGFTRLVNVASSQGRRKRQASTDTVYPLDSATYYILVAQGPASAGVKSIHRQKLSSDSPVNFTAFESATAGDNLTLNLIKAHGILMVLAWMVFASFGMLMPRYCKMAWPDTKWCGKAVWFQIHQPCMIITLLMTTTAFIIIFVEAKDYVSDLPPPCVAHPPLGIIVMALVLINPIMAIFRCEPKAKNRPIFNICHFIVGLLAHLTAVVTIFLGLYMTQLGLPLWTKGVMAAFICFHALIEIVLAVHMHLPTILRKSKSASGMNAIELKDQGYSDVPQSTSPTSDSGSTFKTIVLVIHLCVVVGCAVAISAQIGLSAS